MATCGAHSQGLPVVSAPPPPTTAAASVTASTTSDVLPTK